MTRKRFLSEPIMALVGYNFTERVRGVLAEARRQAGALDHEYIGTEHILLGLATDSDGVAVTVLRNLGVDPSEVADHVRETVRRGKPSYTTGPDLPYTPRAKKVLELAMAQARDLNHRYLGTEHLLLGLLEEQKGIATQALRCGQLSRGAVRCLAH